MKLVKEWLIENYVSWQDSRRLQDRRRRAVPAGMHAGQYAIKWPLTKFWYAVGKY